MIGAERSALVLRRLRGLRPQGVRFNVFVIGNFVLVAFLICAVPVLADSIKWKKPIQPCRIELRVIYTKAIFCDVWFRSFKGITVSNSSVIVTPVCPIPYEWKGFCRDLERWFDCREGDLGPRR